MSNIFVLFARGQLRDPRQHSFAELRRALLERSNLQFVHGVYLDVADCEVEPLLMAVRVVVVLYKQLVPLDATVAIRISAA